MKNMSTRYLARLVVRRPQLLAADSSSHRQILITRTFAAQPARRDAAAVAASEQTRLSKAKYENYDVTPSRNKWDLPKTPARTRFAPSPTGYLHLGSLRTALFNYLLASATGGQFLLRIEDTDQKRLVPDAEERLYEDLKWCGLSWDEGPDVGGSYGPYKQSERLPIYHEHANELLERGHAYRCFCTEAELDEMKKLAMASSSEDVMYNNKCSHISPAESAERAAKGEAHCIRLKCDPKPPVVKDLIYGYYKNHVSLENFIIIKRDGFPTYHFANVIDDHLMGITHVVRGAEWLVSTPRHVALYDAFGWNPPTFAHVGLLVDANKQKLSKRTGDISLEAWKEKGILPEALLNYVLLLGWAPKRQGRKTSEVMTMQEMLSEFHLKFTRGDIMLNNKYASFQKHHIQSLMNGKRGEEAKTNLIRDLVPNVSAIIAKFEQARKSPTSAPSFQDVGGGGKADADREEIGVHIGEILPSIGRDEQTKQPVISEAYMARILEWSAHLYGSLESLVRYNSYTIWQLPKEQLEARVPDDGLEGLVKVAGESKEPVSVTQAAEEIRSLLLQVPAETWNAEQIATYVKGFVEGIRGPADGPNRGWHLLRWMLYGGAQGPGLLAVMEEIGRDETLRRVEMAIDVAKRLDM